MAITVRDTHEGHTKPEIKKVIKARKLQGMMDHPSQKDFEGMVHHGMIKNCSVSTYV